MHAIDYGHKEGDILYHGTVSNLDGEPKATWTYEENGRKVTREQPIEQMTLAFLCYGLDNLALLRQYVATDPSQQIDPVRFHVVGYLIDEGDERSQQMFLIPAAEQHPDFRRWLAALNVSRRSPGAEEPSTESRVVAKARQFFEPSLDHVNFDALLASADRRVVLMLFAFGALKAFEKPAKLTQAQLESAFLLLIQQSVGWFIESEGEVIQLMRDTLTPAGDAELREIMQRGKKAIAAWHANPGGDDVKALGALLDEFVTK
jgi:hypothetical protein